ncbi:hypothetical protein EDC65_2505 [Stella humosa]|uniref:Uncharacterized protein n=1 Tax=Stella humosa TaxID=94 RepID=A0A3N1LCA1_9PROT|nr:hypothetical protein [Stella humosa]ROP90651.1 hypothetical protein EDC65_2505 [Stella humosa]BBK29450.1 hypothetical protein STHU_00840 [Stella humosa]
MTYRISAADATGAIGLERTNAVAALKKARELEAASFRNVRVIDPEGHEHAVEEFAQSVTTANA